jgi:YebC/PmpR family DNA-binding regulatory protein
MPHDNIDRAIKKGTGELEGVQYDEIQYEGYGPSGVAVLVQVMTDNRNRTVSEIRRIFSKHGGNMGESGCVAWMFSKRGQIAVDKSQVDEERLMEIALEAGANDVVDGGDAFEITTSPDGFESVKESIEKAGITCARASVDMVAQGTVSVTGTAAEQTLKLVDELEEHDDVQEVASNFEIPEEELERLSAA